MQKENWARSLELGDGQLHRNIWTRNIENLNTQNRRIKILRHLQEKLEEIEFGELKSIIH